MNIFEIIVAALLLLIWGAFVIFILTGMFCELKETLNPLYFLKHDSGEEKIKNFLLTIFGWFMIIGTFLVLFGII